MVRAFCPGFPKNRRVEKEGVMGEEKGKKGGPKNAGISDDIYENKGREKGALGESDYVVENNDVIPLIRRC